MTYRYKLSPDGKITQRKAKRSARGDRMKPSIHYDQDSTTTYMAEKTSFQALIAIAAAKQWAVEHFDITSAYLHEKYTPDRNFYIKQHPKFDGTYKHACKGSRLRKIYIRNATRIPYLLRRTNRTPQQHNYQQAEADPSKFSKHSAHGTLITAVSICLPRSPIWTTSWSLLQARSSSAKCTENCSRSTASSS